jgi:excisionase family DNA binding protein
MADTIINHSDYLNIKQAAEYLRMNPLTLNRLCQQGKVPAFKLFGRWMIGRERLEEWMKERIRI